MILYGTHVSQRHNDRHRKPRNRSSRNHRLLLGLLFIILQLMIRDVNTGSIRPEYLITVFKNILLAMFLLTVAAAGITWVFMQNTDPNLILPAGLITLTLVILLISSAIVVRPMIKGTLASEED